MDSEHSISPQSSSLSGKIRAWWKSIQRQDWFYILLAFLVLRLLITGVTAMVATKMGNAPALMNSETHFRGDVPIPDNTAFSRLFVAPWLRWDSYWYAKMALSGLDASDQTVAFPILYPLLIRFALPLTGGEAIGAGLIVSALFSLIMMFLFYGLASEILDSREEAALALVFLLLIPTGWFFFGVFTEPLFMTLMLLLWWLSLRGRWWWAALVGLLIPLARHQGVTVILPLAWILFAGTTPQSFFIQGVNSGLKNAWDQARSATHWQEVWGRFRGGGWLALLTPVLSYFGWRTWLSMNGFAAFEERMAEMWDWHFIPPWMIPVVLPQRLMESAWTQADVVNVIFLVCGIVLIMLAIRIFDFSATIYHLVTLTLFLTWDSTHPLESLPRYMLAFFPLFLMLGRWGNRHRKAALVIFALWLPVYFLLLAQFLYGGWVA